MYSLRGIVQCLSLVLILTKPVFTKIIRFDDGGITYEYDNSSKPLGVGAFGKVYEGIRTEGNQTKSVAFKEIKYNHRKLLKESQISEMVGHHDSFPTFYRYFPETNETKAVFVMELIGKTLNNLWNEFRPFPSVTVTQIGLQILDALEWMHGEGITHNDLHSGNIAVGYHNKSKIYLFDFSITDLNKNRGTADLSRTSDALNEIIRSNLFDEAYEPNNALKEFELVARKYNRNINDDVFRNETFVKLRNILMTELESHKNDADYEKYDIGCIQDADDGIHLVRKLIKQNDTTAIENLLKSDEELIVSGGFGSSWFYKPIHLAAELGNAYLVELFIEHGAEVNTKYNDTHYAMSPLHCAAIKGSPDVVRILCENGAEINARILNGKIPLHYAAMNDRNDTTGVDVLSILIEHGAEINAKCSEGSTPLHYAAENGCVDVVQFLIEHGADIKAEDNIGNTPIHSAAIFGHVELIRILIEHGADINAKCLDGKTPLHYAVQYRHKELAQFLIESGADINAEDNRGKTPVQYGS